MDLGEINRRENREVIALVIYERKARGNLAFADDKKFKDTGTYLLTYVIFIKIFNLVLNRFESLKGCISHTLQSLLFLSKSKIFTILC